MTEQERLKSRTVETIHRTDRREHAIAQRLNRHYLPGVYRRRRHRKDVQDLINGRSVLSREKRMAIAGSLGIVALIAPKRIPP